MDRTRFQRLIDVLGIALRHPPEEREAVLASECAGDTALLAEARVLLADTSATSLADVTRRLEQVVEDEAIIAADNAPHPVHIGPYAIERQLGHGGMGIVYLGRQEHPLRRTVAIKVVRTGSLNPDGLARFAAERQAMARMEHAAIARVYDAGITDDRLPYFAMELVDGIPITDYCASNKVPLDARLQLFMVVCHAVHHAHQRGVIHRDLKPSNILVAQEERQPLPKIIDFGIAKAIDGILADEDIHTRTGSVLGTIEYMSPEQIRGSASGIDVRSDVYALGVILYELVTDRHPYTNTTLRRAGLLEAQRIVLDSDPARPSSTLAGVSGGTRVERMRLRRIREDLDWIVMKAIEKDPERRYQSALELARDLDLYANHQPVSARAPTRRYRARKFVRRHRVGVAATVTILLALLTGSALAAMGYVRATGEARRAEATQDFLSSMLASVQPDQQGREVTVREVLDDARTRIAAGHFIDDPATEASLALVIGQSYEGLGRYDDAQALYERSAELRRQLYGADDMRVHDALYRLGTVLWKRGDLEESLALRLELAEMTERHYGQMHADHAESLSNLGNVVSDMGQTEAALEYLTEAVDVGRRLGPDGELDLARFLNNLGTVYYDLEDYERAGQLFEEARQIRARRLGEVSSPYAITLVNLADTQLRVGDLATAERTYRRAIELHVEIFGEDHPRIAYPYSGLAEVLLLQGRLIEAEEHARHALDIRITAGQSSWLVAAERQDLAAIMIAGGRLHEAEAELLTAWSRLVAAGEEAHPRAHRVAAAMAALQTTLGNAASAVDWARLSEAR